MNEVGWCGEKSAELGVGNWIEFPSKGSHKAGAVNVTLKDGYQILKRNVDYVERGPRTGHSGVKRWKMAPGTAGDCYQRLGIAFDQHFSVLISGSHLAHLRPFVQPSMTLNILSLRLHMHSHTRCPLECNQKQFIASRIHMQMVFSGDTIDASIWFSPLNEFLISFKCLPWHFFCPAAFCVHMYMCIWPIYFQVPD